jgi:hypothetical protein
MLRRKITQLALRVYDTNFARHAAQATEMKDWDLWAADPKKFIEVHDRGSSVTIFSFAGAAALYAGLPSFEFRRILDADDHQFNMVFLRDIHRLNYHITPSGQQDGLRFYEEEIMRLMDSLNTSYSVTLGLSVGGSAALYFGARCGMNQVLAFSPAYPLDIYTSAWNQFQTYADLRRLIRSPKAYAELVLVTLAAANIERRLKQILGTSDRWHVLDTYQRTVPRPLTTIFYGAECRPDAAQTLHFREMPDVKTVPLPTEFHNCAGYLKREGKLGKVLLNEITAGIASYTAQLSIDVQNHDLEV